MGNHLATIDMGQNVGAAVPFIWAGEARSLSNTMWPRPRPTFIPSSVSIHPAVWPEQTRAKNGRGAAVDIGLVWS